MIKQGIINFFKNLKYFFTPLGTLFLGILFGVCFLLAGFKTQIKEVTTNIQTITAEANVDVNDLKNCVIESFSDLSWDKPLETIKTVLSKDWFENNLKVNLENTIDNYKAYAQDIENAVSDAINGYMKYVAGFLVCTILGLIAGFFLTKFLIRRNIARRNILKFLMITLVDSILTMGITALTLWLTFLWTPSIIIASVLGIILYGFISLFEAYLVHGYKKINVKQIVNLKNILKLFCSNVIIYLISLAISGIILAITNVLVGAFIALPLLIVGIIVISLNAEAYVKSEVEKKERKI